MDLSSFQKRISYRGDLKVILDKVVTDYNLGQLLSYEIILRGYEDFNLKAITNKGKYFVKIFADFRTDEEAKKYTDLMKTVVDAGISHPRIYRNPDGYLHKLIIDKSKIRLAVMDYIDGEDFFSLDQKPNEKEIIFLVNQAAKINSLNLRPKFVYDSWAIPNFFQEYEKNKHLLEKEDNRLIEPLVKIFPRLNIDKLPHCFVHGDIISTNVIRSRAGKIYVIDFSVANFYPRIQELAVLLCDLLFIPDKKLFLSNYRLTLNEYRKIIRLEKREIEILPIFIKLAHAMHIISATKEKALGNKLPENEFWLKSGQTGLRFMSKTWD